MRPGPGTAWRLFGRKLLFALLLFLMVAGFAVWVVGKVVSALFSASLNIILVPLLIFAIVRLSTRTWRPVRELIDAAGRLADGDYAARVSASGPASNRQVARSFNDMARRLEEADEQRRRLLADLGHELRTPLTVVRGEIEAIVDGVHDADPEHLEILLDEVAVMERLLEDLRTLSMAEAGALPLHPEPTDLADLVADAVESHRRAADAQAVVVTVNAQDVGEIVVDPVRIREVMSNLVVNALRAMPDGGALRVALHSDRDDAVIKVVDTGFGIEPERIDTMFERFAKGAASPGSGLGLTISRDLVAAHGGTIELQSQLGGGTTATVRLPMLRV